MATKRPRAASVFGLLNLIFGGVGFLGALGGTQDVGAGAPPALRELLSTDVMGRWLEVSQGLALVTAAVTLLLGIALLQMVWWARAGQVWFAVAAMGVGLVTSSVSWAKVQEAADEIQGSLPDDTGRAGDGSTPESMSEVGAGAGDAEAGDKNAGDEDAVASASPDPASLAGILEAFRASVLLGTLLNLGYYGTIAFFMTRPKIREAFEAERSAAG